MNFEAELADLVLARLNDHEVQTIERLKAMGYKITKAKPPKAIFWILWCYGWLAFAGSLIS